MRIFTLIWFGQLVSTIGSYMTFFALTLWAWEVTGSATALALSGFFFQLPGIPMNLVAGLIVDRFNRKRLMLLGDGISAIATITIGLLYLTNALQIWHFYLLALMAGGFSQIQLLAYKASMSLIVPKQQYTRANSMGAIVHYGSNIVGPALAGVLYPLISLSGIVVIDLATFGIAFLTLLVAPIPQPQPQETTQKETWSNKLTFGFRQIWQQPSLRALVLVTVLFTFAHDMGGAVLSPMILARTNGSAQALASVSAAAGIGGVAGALVTSVWGGPKRRIHGMLAGYIGAGLSKTVFGLGQSLRIWVPAQVCSSLNFPLLGSTRDALWMGAIPSEQQGRVFAANSLAIKIVSAIAVLIAGPLADKVLSPVMMTDLAGVLKAGFGTGPSAGVALLYTLCALAIVMLGISGFFIPDLRMIEDNTTPR